MAHSLEEAGLAHRIEAIQGSIVYGIQPLRLFRQAATRYLLENQDNRTIEDDAMRLKLLDRYIGDLTLDKVHIHSLQLFIQARKTLGRKTKIINLTLGVVRQILNLASIEWVDENGLTCLEAAPKIKILTICDQRPSYPLSWEEQDLLFGYLPKHLHVKVMTSGNSIVNILLLFRRVMDEQRKK